MKSFSPGISTYSNSHGCFVDSSLNKMEGSKNKQREREEGERWVSKPAHLRVGCLCREPCCWFCVVLLFQAQVLIHLSISKSPLGLERFYEITLLIKSVVSHSTPSRYIKMHLELHLSIKNQELDFERQTKDSCKGPLRMKIACIALTWLQRHLC